MPRDTKLEWEIAQWSKMRGPSSTAFTELMNIEGVSEFLFIYDGSLLTFKFQVVERLGLTFKNSAELNKLIDKSLPGRPRFERHEIIVGDEVCKVYFRDIIACFW